MKNTGGDRLSYRAPVYNIFPAVLVQIFFIDFQEKPAFIFPNIKN